MFPTPLVWSTCPHCHERFQQNAKFIRPGALLRCPACDGDTRLEADGDAELLEQARLARRARKQHRRQVQASWRLPPPGQRPPGRSLDEIFRSLGDLLDDIDRLAEREPV